LAAEWSKRISAAVTKLVMMINRSNFDMSRSAISERLAYEDSLAPKEKQE